jgi:AcrR family transcriptional regulator
MADIGAEAGIVGSGVYRHFDSKTAILVAMADRVMDRLMSRSAEIIAAGLDEGQSLTLLVRDHIEVALTDRDALAVYHREVRTLPEDERRRLSRAQRHYIEEWVHLLAPLRPDLADGEVRLAVHAAIGAIQSTLFFRSGLADERLTELLEGMAHACLGTDPVPTSELLLTNSGMSLPVAAQRRGELGGPLVREEQAAAVDLDDLGGAGDGVTQPVGPLAAEEQVAGTPDDQGRDLQAAQGGFGRQQVAGAQ